MGKNRTKNRRGQPGRGTKPRAVLYVILGLLAVAAVVWLVAADRGDTDAAAGSDGCGYTPTTQLMDVHGLAVNPSRPSELFVATHHGLFRAVNDTDWARVGSSRDDLMGFSIHPTNGSIVWSSGHPPTGGNLGVRLSTDGGCTWRRTALPGVDFHSMAVSPADPDVLWGYYRGQLQKSRDGGQSWSVINEATPVGSLAPDPRDANRLYAVGQAGVLRSRDGGLSWETLRAGEAAAVAVSPHDPDVLVVSVGRGIARSADGGASWTSVPLNADGGTIGYFAFHPVDPAIVYAATYQTGIYKSTDGGGAWLRVRAPSG